MAPHDTDTPKEARRHIVPLVGMAVLVLAVALGFFWWIAGATMGPGETDAVEENEVDPPT